MVGTANNWLVALKEMVKESGLFPSYTVRQRLAARYLCGTGLEIGALHRPLRVPSGVQVKYVDLVSKEENIQNHPELIKDKIVATDYIENGFELASIPESSQDFLIANHVLEHAPNPLQVLLNWSRVLREKGKMFVSVPIAEYCFDRGRPITTIEHFIKDHRLCNVGSISEFSALNKEHYREWLLVSEPAIMAERRVASPQLSENAMMNRIEQMADSSAEIHFHTFSAESFEVFCQHFVSSISMNCKVIELRKSRGGKEYIAVFQKDRLTC